MSDLLNLIDAYAHKYYGEPLKDEFNEARIAVIEAVEKLERDAARYRWLRDRVFKSGGNLCVEILDGYDEFGMEFDAAIDAAMKEATNGQGD